MKRCFTLEAIAPFDFELTLEATPPAFPFVYEKGILSRAVRLESGKLVPIEVRSIGTVKRPLLEVTVYSDLAEEERDQVERELSWFLCLNDDLSEAIEIMRNDPSLRAIAEAFEGVRPWTEMRVFEGLIGAIIFQQISIWAAFAIVRSLVEKLGSKVEIKGETFYEFPDVKLLASADDSLLRACKLSRNKARYVRSLAKEVLEGRLSFDSLAKMPSERAVEELKKFKGIGTWTAEIFLATSLKKWDIVPADDLGVQRAVGKFCLGNKKASATEVRQVAEGWGRFKWPIAYYLLVASERPERLRCTKVKSAREKIDVS